MGGVSFLKTVTFGGFDKKDVVAYVDELNTKIFNLEEDVNVLKRENDDLKKQLEEKDRQIAALKRECNS